MQYTLLISSNCFIFALMNFLISIDRYVNLDEIALDVAIVVLFSSLRVLRPENLSAILMGDPYLTTICGMFLVFVTSLFISGLYFAYFRWFEGSGLAKALVVVIFFAPVVWSFLSAFFFQIFYGLFPEKLLFVTGPDIPLLTLIMYGFMAHLGANLGNYPEEGTDIVFGLFSVPGMIFIWSSVIIVIFSGFMGRWDLFFFVGVMLSVGILLSKPVLSVVARRILPGRGMANPMFNIFAGVIISLAVAAALVLWRDITVWWLSMSARLREVPLSRSDILLSLVVGGIIPVRVLAMISPPRKILNIAAGLLMFVYCVVMS